ncbi:DUF4382 domain-containing protein [Pseudobdellovibrio sp. HCB154]|uniref:DUF4382 domain-containing protein n=1 Tax=Pseudobdellovibrio sp. HCB154 TaxID=3386277 RepID=UPI00391725F4
MKKNNLWMMAVISTAAAVVACSRQGTVDTSGNSYLSSYPQEKTDNLRVSMTDAPSKDLKNVFVNVSHAELFVNNGGKNSRIVVAQGLGLVDLLTLRNGVLLPMQDFSLPEGVQVTGIRLVLNGDDNHAIKQNDERCEMQTPSGQQSGIKIHLSEPFTIEEGKDYSMIMDFDAEKSVVVKGTGECLLKPVLKMLTVTSKDDEDNSGEETTETPITDGTDSNVGGGDSSSGGGEVVTDPSSGGESSSGTTTVDEGSSASGSEVVDATSDSGTDSGSETTPDSGEQTGFEEPVDPSQEPPLYTEEEFFNVG